MLTFCTNVFKSYGIYFEFLIKNNYKNFISFKIFFYFNLEIKYFLKNISKYLLIKKLKNFKKKIQKIFSKFKSRTRK